MEQMGCEEMQDNGGTPKPRDKVVSYLKLHSGMK